MSTTSIDVIGWGVERVRAGPWRGDRRVAYLHPAPGAPSPSVEFLRHCLDRLAREGYARVVTGALTGAERRNFEAAGFAVSEELHLLAHDLRRLPGGGAGRVRLRRAWPGDRAAVLALDQLAFDRFWRLGEAGLEEAVAATPHARFAVAVAPDDGPVLGYAVTGRCGRRGYVQRLAVHPAHHGQGVGRALVGDGLRWLRRWRVDSAMVNTQVGNERALRLYESLGFRRQPAGLAVLAADLGT